ncbi:hypothetical protein [Psychromicrobium sp. YIM B11713]|uniref:hypothetical protein n=1 Tax=Psychromicrobium sp. YIM B11713 TaxID=3145233 RepID=UPI00374E70AB
MDVIAGFLVSLVPIFFGALLLYGIVRLAVKHALQAYFEKFSGPGQTIPQKPASF